MLLMICHFEDGLEKFKLSAMLYTKVAKYDDTHKRAPQKNHILLGGGFKYFCSCSPSIWEKWVSMCFICSPLFGGKLSNLTCAYFSGWGGSTTSYHCRLCWALVGPRFVFCPTPFPPTWNQLPKGSRRPCKEKATRRKPNFFRTNKNWVVVSNIFIFTPIWGRFPI